MQDVTKLDVWQRAHSMTLDLYRKTKLFPREETYGLTNQIRRAASSIGANIAEGCGREGEAELGRFLQIALGSASELQYHLLLARDLAYVSSGDYERLAAEVTGVKKMLTSLVQKARAAAAS
jgi:four helix bundle protein